MRRILRSAHGHAVIYYPDLLPYRTTHCVRHLTAHVCCPAASFRICADGGANRLYDLMPTLFPDEHPTDVRSRFVPDIIKGALPQP